MRLAEKVIKLFLTLGGQFGTVWIVERSGSKKTWMLRDPWACKVEAKTGVGRGGVSFCWERLETGEEGLELGLVAISDGASAWPEESWEDGD